MCENEESFILLTCSEVFGAAFSVPCFRYIIGMPQYASTGRFVLLAFNLTACK